MIDNLEDQLRRDEGEKLQAYQDHLGYWTIGIGRLIDGRKGGGITREESSALFANDIARIDAALGQTMPWIAKLDEPRRGVLRNMSFQMGPAGVMAFTTTIGHIRAGRYEDAARAMLESKWAEQTPERAVRLAEQMRTGQWK